MRFVLFLALLAFVVLASGCVRTGSLVEDDVIPVLLEEPFEETGNATITETGKQDPCAGVSCPDSLLECPDGFVASCPNSCSGGKCTSCIPVCPCLEKWECSAWSSCVEGKQTRECHDSGGCGTEDARPPVERTCQGSAVISISYVEPYEEWVEIRNSGSSEADLTGWTLKDDTSLPSHRFTFPSFTLGPGSSVKILKGRGEDSQSELYWGNSLNIWNNGGDVAYLFDAGGSLVDRYPY
jgi:hypothetical protein